MNFYNKGVKATIPVIRQESNLGTAGQGIAKAFMDLGDIKQKSDDRTEILNLKKETKFEKEKNKKDMVSGFKKLHPKTTNGLSDDEIYAMGDRINKVHTDPTKAKFVNAYTAENGDRVMVTFNGNDKDGNPIYKNVVVGKAKDYSQSHAKDEDNSKVGINLNKERRKNRNMGFDGESMTHKKLLEEFNPDLMTK